MKYLVMECHPAYAIVLDEKGRFFRVANLQYQVGQQLDEVFDGQPQSVPRMTLWKRVAQISAAAACLCLTMLGTWQLALVPCGTVRMQINPDISISVNRLDYVTGIEGLNEEGKQILEDYSSTFKKLDTVTDQLADRAVEMGYLEEGGRITLTVESESQEWKTATEERLLLELEVYFDNQIVVVVTSSEQPGNSELPLPQEIIIPVPSQQSAPVEEESPVENENTGVVSEPDANDATAEDDDKNSVQQSDDDLDDNDEDDRDEEDDDDNQQEGDDE